MMRSDNIGIWDYVIVSYYTSGHYEKVINEYLLSSLKRYKLPYYVEEVSGDHTWGGNTNIKGVFMQKMLDMFPDKKVIWIDADARIETYPLLFEGISGQCDMGVFYLDLDKWYNTTRYYGKQELGSGIVMMRNRPIVQSVVRKWIAGIKASPAIWEQKHLQMAVESTPDLKLFRFPLEYSYICSLPNGQPPHIKLPHPVVVQYQASRDVKRRNIKV